MYGHAQLVRQAGMGGNIGLRSLGMSSLKRAGRPPGATEKFQLSITGLPRQVDHLLGQGGAFIEPIRDPQGCPPGTQCAAERSRVTEAPRHVERLPAER